LVAEGEILDGTYRLDRLIGEGGMGTVYEATHARLAGRYAIKVLLRELAVRSEIRARFDREARITSQLQHPNIVQVIDTNSTADGTSYLVMELLAGESLAARLARFGPLAPPVVVDIVDQIAAGVAAAHARGIVHRDLKPDNIFLVPVEGRATELVKILDFGISKLSGSGDPTDREICGTPQYMAPEQVEGRAADVDGATDQYALGVIAYELLTGTNPFAAASMTEIFARVRSGVVPPTGLPGGIDSVLTRAMSETGSGRFPSVTTFADAFRAAALAAPPAAVMVTLPPGGDAPGATAGRRLRRARPRWRLGFAAAAAIATTSFLGTGAANRPPSSGTTPRQMAPVLASRVTPVAATEAAARDAIAPACPPAPIAAVPILPPVEVSPRNESRGVHLPIARTRKARAAVDNRPRSAIPAAPVAGKLRPALPPDEDATMAPSADMTGW